MKEWTPAITAVRADRREKGGKRGVRTCGDAGNDEPEDASNSAEDPAPVRDGRVRVAIGRVESVVADLDHGRAVVRHLHAQHDDPAHTHTHTHTLLNSPAGLRHSLLACARCSRNTVLLFCKCGPHELLETDRLKKAAAP